MWYKVSSSVEDIGEIFTDGFEALCDSWFGKIYLALMLVIILSTSILAIVSCIKEAVGYYSGVSL